MKRFYFDYNATAPFSQNVKRFLREGSLPFANPASTHTAGKFANKHIQETHDFLYEFFGMNKKFGLYFHSGATEAINTFFYGLKKEYELAVAYFQTDHPAVVKTVETLFDSDKRIAFTCDKEGNFPEEFVIKTLEEFKKAHPKKEILFNFTYMHNETGVIWPLSLAQKIKEQTGCLVHVDCVQIIGKMPDFNRLALDLDFYTFSGHKFGALKSTGMSFFRRGLKISPLIHGGGQQRGMRSGTQDALGIYSLMLALKDRQQLSHYKEMESFKQKVIRLLGDTFGNDILIVAQNTEHPKNTNTIFFVHKKMSSDLMLIHFDLEGLDVSMGAACASASAAESSTLISMGHGPYAKNAIRLSFGPHHWQSEAEILSRLKSVFNKISQDI